jgi:hypothetical protein
MDSAMRVVYEPEIEEHDPALYDADCEAVIYAGWEAARASIPKYEAEGYVIVRNGISAGEVEAARLELEGGDPCRDRAGHGAG